MKKTDLLTIIFLLLSFSLINATFGQEKLDLANGNLEGVNADGNFYWWKNQAINGADATYSIEYNDVNTGSKKALKVQVNTLGEKPWFVSSQFNQSFKGKPGDEITVEFYAKNSGAENGKLKLVFQSDVQGSFQGKDFYLTEYWQKYTHTFTVEAKSSKNQIKFWYMEAGTTYYLDDLSVQKKDK